MNKNSHTLVINGESFSFATAELATSTGYEYARDYPDTPIARYRDGVLVSHYSPKYGWC